MNSIKVTFGDLCECGRPFCFIRSPEYQNLPCWHSICDQCFEKQIDRCIICNTQLQEVEIIKALSHRQQFRRKITYYKVYMAKSPGDNREMLLWKLNLKPTAQQMKDKVKQ